MPEFRKFLPRHLSHALLLPVALLILLFASLTLHFGQSEPEAEQSLWALILSLAAVLPGAAFLAFRLITPREISATDNMRSRSVDAVRLASLVLSGFLLTLSALLVFVFGNSISAATVLVLSAGFILTGHIISARLSARVLNQEQAEPQVKETCPRSVKSLLVQTTTAVLLGCLAAALSLSGLGGYYPAPDLGVSLSVGCSTLIVLWPHACDYLGAYHQKRILKTAERENFLLAEPPNIETLPHLGAVVFDRDALMAETRMVVTDVKPFDQQPEVLLSIAATAEAFANHPIGLAIRDLARDWNVAQDVPEEQEEADGLGVVALIGGEPVAVGNAALMDQLKIDSFTATSLCRSLESAGKTCVMVALGTRVIGVLALEGSLHASAPVAVADLRRRGCATLLVSGTSAATTRWFSETIGAEGFRHGIMPQDRANTAATAVGHLNALFVYRPKRAAKSLLICLINRNGDRVIRPIAQDLSADPSALPNLLDLAQDLKVRARKTSRFALGSAAVLAVPAFMGLVPLALAPVVAILPVIAACFGPDIFRNMIRSSFSEPEVRGSSESDVSNPLASPQS